MHRTTTKSIQKSKKNGGRDTYHTYNNIDSRSPVGKETVLVHLLFVIFTLTFTSTHYIQTRSVTQAHVTADSSSLNRRRSCASESVGGRRRRESRRAAAFRIQLGTLHWAAWKGKDNVVAYLLEGCGVYVDKVDNHNCTALYLAAFGNHPSCISLLLRHGADPNIVTTGNLTPLMRAAYYGEVAFMTVLLQDGC